MNFVGAVTVPDYQLAILTGRDQVPAVTRPVHGVYLGQVTTQCPPGSHVESTNGFQLLDLLCQCGVSVFVSVSLKLNIN